MWCFSDDYINKSWPLKEEEEKIKVGNNTGGFGGGGGFRGGRGGRGRRDRDRVDFISPMFGWETINYINFSLNKIFCFIMDLLSLNRQM